MKEFKSFDQQKEHLIENKKFKDSEIIKKILKERSYVSIINPIKFLFATSKSDNTHKYLKNDMKNYIAVIKKEEEIALSYFEMISIFERKIKLLLAYYYSEKMSIEKDKFCVRYIDDFRKIKSKVITTKYKNKLLEKNGFVPLNLLHKKEGVVFNKSVKNERLDVIKKIYEISIGKTKIKHAVTKHYVTEYKKLPFWLLFHELNFGEIAIIFKMSNEQIRKKIYLDFFKDDQQANSKEIFSFDGIIEKMRLIRNKICHNESLIAHLHKDLENSSVKQHLKLISFLKKVQKDYNNLVNNYTTPNIQITDFFSETNYKAKIKKELKVLIEQFENI